MTKTCIKCKKTKPVTGYGKNARYTDGLQRTCLECWNAAAAAYRAENLTRVREIECASQKKRYAEDPEKRARISDYKKGRVDKERTLARARYVANPEHYRQRMRDWYSKNPDAVKRDSFTKRARKANVPGRATKEQITARMAVWDNLCWICSEPADTVDHVIPLAKGGSNWPANLRPACRTCNSRKGARPFSVAHKKLISVLTAGSP